MSCAQVHELLDAYIDRELDVASALEFERHLVECDACRAIHRQYQDLHASVKAQFPYFEAPPELESKIRARLRPAGEPGRLRGYQRPWRLQLRNWTIAAAAAVLLVLLGTFLVQTLRRTSASEMVADEVVSAHIRSLMGNHVFDVPSSDQHTVKPWFNGRLDYAPTVKDLSSAGFPLAGGRLDYLDNRPVAALIYKRRQHTINLFVWPSSDSDSGPRSIAIRGYNIVHWTQSHMTYWAVSDLNAAELKDFVRIFSQR